MLWNVRQVDCWITAQYQVLAYAELGRGRLSELSYVVHVFWNTKIEVW